MFTYYSNNPVVVLQSANMITISSIKMYALSQPIKYEIIAYMRGNCLVYRELKCRTATPLIQLFGL